MACQGVTWGMRKSILQLLLFMLFVHLDVPLFLSYRWLSQHLFLVFWYLFTSVMGWKMEYKSAEPTSFSFYQMSFDIVSCVSMITHEQVLHVLLLTQPFLPSLASLQSTLAYDKSAYFLKALISYTRWKLVTFSFYFCLLQLQFFIFVSLTSCAV